MIKYLFTLITSLVIISFANAQYSVDQGDSDRITTLNALIAALDDDHCEVPCGIYGDSLRISLIKEHVSTIEKAMNQINELSKAETPNYNQLIRWVVNKETHAEEIQHIVAQYFLHQRVKIPASDLGAMEMKAAKNKYFNQLSSLHAIQVYAMKCKQSTDLNQVGKISTAIEDFEDYYFHGHKH